MSEDRLEHIEKMVTELIHIVANTNAIVKEMRSDIDVIKYDIVEMKADIVEMKADIVELKQGQIRLENAVREIKEEQKSFFEMMGEHDVAIRTLRRRTV